MSWNSWNVVGVGFGMENVKPDKYKAFIMKHEKSLIRADKAKILKVTAENYLDYLEGEWQTDPDVDDFNEIREISYFYAIAEPIAAIIAQETGIDFCAPGLSENDMDCVMFVPKYPWEMNEKEKVLSSIDEVVDILKPYAEELGLEVDTDIVCEYMS